LVCSEGSHKDLSNIKYFKKSLFSKKPGYIVIYSTSAYLGIRQIMELKWKGYNIIYSYLDEISVEILGNVPATNGSLDIFNKLEQIDPDLIITSAKKLYAEMLLRFPKEKVILVPNGVDVENFSQQTRDIPKDIKEINNPIIGYYGALAPWLDYEVLNRLSKERPNYNFVYIGDNYNGGLYKLDKRDNVYFLGPRHYRELGKYSALFDVCMIPFREGEIAKATSPLKLFEYMAARKPVVVTKDLVECYGYEGVLVSKNHDDFIANIDRALELGKDENIKERLFEYAKQNTCEKRAQTIEDKLTELEGLQNEQA
jgi:glycosyltransferase involved in cell wall biosynthesis